MKTIVKVNTKQIKLLEQNNNGFWIPDHFMTFCLKGLLGLLGEGGGLVANCVPDGVGRHGQGGGGLCDLGVAWTG